MSDVLYLYPDSIISGDLNGGYYSICDLYDAPDEDASFVENAVCGDSTYSSLYGLQDSEAIGAAISKITVYYRWKYTGDNAAGCWCQIKTHDTLYYINEVVNAPVAYRTDSKEWVNNPFTGAAWTWAEINDLKLQIISHWHADPYGRGRCTQAYVKVEGDWYDPPTLHTDAATSIDHVSGILNAETTVTGGLNSTVRGFQWKKGVAGDVTTVPEVGDWGIGVFYYNLIGLENYIEYYFRAYATNWVDTTYGEWLTFTTLRTYPTVTVQAPINFFPTTVTANGNITALGGENSTIRGFEWGLSKRATWSQHLDGSFTIGAFTEALTGLTANTEYWIRAYATNSIGTAYSEWIQFQTAAVGVIPTGTKIDICSDYTGYTYQLQKSETDNGFPYTGYFVISTDLADGGGLSYYKRVLDLDLYFRSETAGTCEVYVKRDSEATWFYLGSVSLIGTEDIIIKHLAPDTKAKHFLFKISSANAFRFLGCLYQFVPGGDR